MELAGRSRQLSTSRQENAVHDVVGHLPPLEDALGLVEAPVDAQINAALAVLILGLGKGLKTARHVRSDVALIVLGNTVELIGDEGEGDVVGAIEAPQRLEHGPAETGMARGIRRKGRGEVRPVQVAGRGAQRGESRVALGRRVAVALAGGSGAWA